MLAAQDISYSATSLLERRKLSLWPGNAYYDPALDDMTTLPIHAAKVCEISDHGL